MLTLLNDANIKINISKKKLKETEKDFKELRDEFSKEEIDIDENRWKHRRH